LRHSVLHVQLQQRTCKHVTVERNVSPLCNRYLVLTSERVTEFITNCALFCPYKARIWPSGKLCALVRSVQLLYRLQTNSAFAIHESSLRNSARWQWEVTVRIKAKYFYDLHCLGCTEFSKPSVRSGLWTTDQSKCMCEQKWSNCCQLLNWKQEMWL